MNNRDNLAQVGYKVVNDLTFRQRQQLRNLKSQGKNGYFNGGRLIIDDSNRPAYEHERAQRIDHNQDSVSMVYRERVFTRSQYNRLP